MEHALDSDHIVAVSTIVSLNRRPLRAVLVGAFWGIGHTLTLLLVGLAVIIFKLVIPFQLALSMEFLVGVVLVILGAQILGKYRIKKVHSHPHFTHYHKSILVGVFHGLAGSAALMLFVFSTVRSAFEGVVYILLFGVGSILGMMVVSTIIGLLFALSAHRLASVNRPIRLVAGMVSVILGIIIMINIGIVDGLINKP